jgi:TRAP-type C4-dicarboxylate transport system permease large subunit
MHPVQFGVVMVLNLMIGLLTPPMAICLFITSKIGNISFERAFKAVTPYYIALLLVLLLINIFPPLTLAIPQLIFGESL